MNLDDTTALVTGGASGIGEASARRLTAKGARCVLLDLDETRGTVLAGELGGVFVPGDVADEEAVAAAVAAATDLGVLRSVVNAAGIGNAGRTIDRQCEPLPQRKFERVIRVNLLGTFNVIRLAAAAMARAEPIDDDGQRGAIVNVASIAAFDGQIGQAAYSASKGGVVGMTLPIARDLAVNGIRVNTVAPGLVDTPIYGSGESAEAFKDRLAASVLFPRRLGTADELARMIVDLLENDFVNGETVRIDGGIRLPPK